MGGRPSGRSTPCVIVIMVNIIIIIMVVVIMDIVILKRVLSTIHNVQCPCVCSSIINSSSSVLYASDEFATFERVARLVAAVAATQI